MLLFLSLRLLLFLLVTHRVPLLSFIRLLVMYLVFLTVLILLLNLLTLMMMEKKFSTLLGIVTALAASAALLALFRLVSMFFNIAG